VRALRSRRGTSRRQRAARREKLKRRWSIPSGRNLLLQAFERVKSTPVVTCSFSGGRDSLASTLLTLDLLLELDRFHRVYVLFNDTTNEFPENVRYVRRMMGWFEDEYDQLNLRTVVTRPKRPYSTMVEEMFRVAVEMYEEARWDKSKLTCCDEVKLKPLKHFIRISATNIVVSGVRGDESGVRFLSFFFHGPITGSLHTWSGRGSFIKVSPLWTWSVEEVEEYLEKHPKKPPANPLYARGHEGIGCMLCPVPFIYNRPLTKKTYPRRIYEYGMQLLRKAIEETGQQLLESYLGRELLLEEEPT